MKDDIKGEVYSTSFHSQNERLRNMNMDGQKILLCEDYNDLTIPTSNHMPDIHLFISVVYGTFEKFFLTYPCSYSLIFHFDFGMKLSTLPL